MTAAPTYSRVARDRDRFEPYARLALAGPAGHLLRALHAFAAAAVTCGCYWEADLALHALEARVNMLRILPAYADDIAAIDGRAAEIADRRAVRGRLETADPRPDVLEAEPCADPQLIALELAAAEPWADLEGSEVGEYARAAIAASRASLDDHDIPLAGRLQLIATAEIARWKDDGWIEDIYDAEDLRHAADLERDIRTNGIPSAPPPAAQLTGAARARVEADRAAGRPVTALDDGHIVVDAVWLHDTGVAWDMNAPGARPRPGDG